MEEFEFFRGSAIADKTLAAPNIATPVTSATQRNLSPPNRQQRAPIADAAHEMLEHKIGCLPVISKEKNQEMIGLITETDILQAFLDQLGYSSNSR